MSVVTSILKPFSSAEGYRATSVTANKVRFSSPKERGLAESVRVALEEGNFHPVKEFTNFIRQAEINVCVFIKRNLYTLAERVL